VAAFTVGFATAGSSGGTMASVSWTGRSADTSEAESAEDAIAAGAGGVAFWRSARKPPPPAAVMHAAATSVNASLFENMT
jgi:hypothetical protein